MGKSVQLNVCDSRALPVPVKQACLALLLCSLSIPHAMANTTTVFSPDVKEGTSALEYRSSYVPSDDGQRSSFSHRLHYQRAIDDTWRWRLIGQQSRRGDDSLKYRYSRLELQMQYREDEQHGYDAALRYELQISDDDNRPSRFRLAWTGKYDLASDWQLRGNVLLGREWGDEAGNGILLETRLQATYPVFENSRFGVESFSDFNRTTDIGDWDDQEHQFGPIFKTRVGPLKVDASYLLGLSDSTPDQNVRLIFTWDI